MILLTSVNEYLVLMGLAMTMLGLARLAYGEQPG